MIDTPTERDDEGAWAKLRRRKVVQWGIAYAAAAWTLLQVLEYFGETYAWPRAVRQISGLALPLGLLFVLVLAWYHGDKGDQRVSRPEFAILATIVAFVGGTLWWYVSRIDESAWIADTGTSEIRNAAPIDARPSIAVLPFENRSRLEDDAFFVDGIHDDILTQLSKLRALKVISRTSVEQFRDTKLTTKEIGEKLSVSKILEGGVQRAGDRVRINVQLIDVATDAHLWAESYDRELTAANIFAIQSEVSAAIAGALKATLTPAERARAGAVPTQSLDAWEAYQIGKQRMANRTSTGMAEAETFFRKAIELDPGFALAYVGLAESVGGQSAYGGAPRDVSLASAETAVGTALELDPNLAEAWATSGVIATRREQYERAEKMFRRAIELNSNDATAYYRLADLLGGLRRAPEALTYAQRAVELDPLSPIANWNLASQLENLGRFNDAEARLYRLIQIDPSMPIAYRLLAQVRAYGLNEFPGAVPLLQKARELDPGNPNAACQLAALYLDLDDDVQTMKAIEDAEQRWPTSPRVHLCAALIHATLGSQERATQHAQKGLETWSRETEALAILSNDDLKMGDHRAARARYQKSYPELLGPEPPRVDGSTYGAAVDVVRILQKTGEGDRARTLLAQSEQVISTIPRVGAAGYGIADVKIFALRGDKAKAVEALREAERAGWRGPFWRYYRDVDPALASIRNAPEFKAVFADIERDMARQRAELAARPKDAPLDVGAASR